MDSIATRVEDASASATTEGGMPPSLPVRRRLRTKKLPDPSVAPPLIVADHIKIPKGFSFQFVRPSSLATITAIAKQSNNEVAVQQSHVLQPAAIIVDGAVQSRTQKPVNGTADSSAVSSPKAGPSSPTTTASTSEFTDSALASSVTSASHSNTAVSRSWADLVRSPNRSLLASPSQRVNGAMPSEPVRTANAAASSAAALSKSPRTSAPPLASATALNGVVRSRTSSPSIVPVTVAGRAETDQTVIPRGLVNSGNLCFINAVLQLLVYTKPFWQLCLDLRQATSNDLRNPRLLDAIISFLSEFRICGHDALPDMYNAQTGPSKFPQVVQDPPFVPTQVYESLKGNKRFDTMRRGTQEDAEEFLGFLLETLHEELVKLEADQQEKTSAARAASQPQKVGDDDWVEVGTKGKVAVTRTTDIKESALTQILGGSLRSTLRCAGSKDSVTLEPFQRLQLDIQPAHVRTIEDALLHLCAPEQLPDFHPRASKQLSFDTLPPVLIVHLKRFLYTAAGGTQKSGKRIQFRDVLDIDERCISPAKRGQKRNRYRLYAVVYHHGPSAHGGHYTVAVRSNSPQYSLVTSTVTGAKEAVPAGVADWIHIDDTLVKAVAVTDVTSVHPFHPYHTSQQQQAGPAVHTNGAGTGSPWTEVLKNQSSIAPQMSRSGNAQNEENERDAYLLCYFLEP